MKKILLLFFTVFLVIGCKSPQFVHVFETSGLNTSSKSGLHVFENDTLKITYAFNSEEGAMAFSINNKLKKPIYIDWDKSTFTSVSGGLSYGKFIPKSEKELEYEFENLSVLVIDTLKNKSSGIGKRKLQKPISIGPGETYENVKFHLLPVKYYQPITGAVEQVVNSNEFPGKKIIISKTEFKDKESPIRFTNNFTFYLSKNFREEFSVKNEFYVSQILKMPKNHFMHPSRDDNGKIIKKRYRTHYHYPQQFFIYINKK